MDAAKVTKLFEAVQKGSLMVEEALEKLKDLPYQDLGFARLDSHRGLRLGFPEVILCQGKTLQQIVAITKLSLKHNSDLLLTRASEEVYKAVRRITKGAEFNPLARTVVVKRSRRKPTEGRVLIITAGTSDIPVAEEATVTAETLGSAVEKLYDVGTAGLHRLLSEAEKLRSARVLVVVAGMDGVLPSIVGGLIDKPVIAVPTSEGYGASFGGLAPLLTMLNSCAPGVCVVNIDNGFGAGFLAHRINLLGEKKRTE